MRALACSINSRDDLDLKEDQPTPLGTTMNQQPVALVKSVMDPAEDRTIRWKLTTLVPTCHDSISSEDRVSQHRRVAS